MKRIGLSLLTAFVGGAVAIGAYKLVEKNENNGLSFEDKQKVYFANNPSPSVSSAGAVDFTQAAAAVTPAVVHIKTTYSGSARGSQRSPMEDMFEDFFGGRPQSRGPQMASGSGVIISEDGYIVTNNHVVDNASKIEVVLNDKRSYEAKVVGKDSNTDLALIKVTASKLPMVKLGNSDNVRVGEWVLAVGNPFNLTSTVTAGIVSAKGRSIGILGDGQDPEVSTSRPIEAFIQTDAAINRGNSGGALVNTSGELIGINAAIASQTGNYEGYGFAIPVNLAKKVLDDFVKYGSVKRGFLGVQIGDVNAQLASEKGLSSTQGVYVSSVTPGGAAASAGLKEGDVITKIEGVTVNSVAELQEQVGRHGPGDKVNMVINRDNSVRTISVTLKEDSQLAAATSPAATATASKLGASFSPLSETQKKKYGISSGLVVSSVKAGGLFDQIDLPQGTIVTSVNGRQVSTMTDLNNSLAAGRNGMIQLSAITPDGSQVRFSFPIQ